MQSKPLQRHLTARSNRGCCRFCLLYSQADHQQCCLQDAASLHSCLSGLEEGRLQLAACGMVRAARHAVSLETLLGQSCPGLIVAHLHAVCLGQTAKS